MSVTELVYYRLLLLSIALTVGVISSCCLPLEAIWLKCRREKIQAKMLTLEVMKNDHFSAVYQYEIDQQLYVGNNLFDDKIKMERMDLQFIRAKIMVDSVVWVYYATETPSSAIVFLNEKAIAFPINLLGCALFSWIFLGGFYIRARYVDKESNFLMS